VKETHADSGCSSSISKDVDDFIQLFYQEDPYLIDTPQDGVMMKTHFYGTTRTWAGGDRGEKLLLTQEDVLWVPEASGESDLLSLGKLTRISFKALLHAGKLDLIYVDPERLGEVGRSITAVNDVYPISLTAAKRADAETRQVQETLPLHRKFISKAFSAFPRVLTVKHIGEEKLPEGEGEAYLNHVCFGHRIGRPGRHRIRHMPVVHADWHGGPQGER
jgi:hypothetical protein